MLNRYTLTLLYCLIALVFAAALLAKPRALPQKDPGKIVNTQPPTRCHGNPLDDELTSPNTELPIPDGPGGVLLDSFQVSETTTIEDLDLRVDITHAWVRDLTLILTHTPNGGEARSITLLDLYPAGFVQNMDSTWFNDEAWQHLYEAEPPFAGDYRPLDPLSTFDGRSATGWWRLEVRDRFDGDAGTLHSWGIEINHVDVLTGIITTESTETGVPFATVELIDTTAHPDSVDLPLVKANAFGEYNFPRLTPGTYSFRVSHPFAETIELYDIPIATGDELPMTMVSSYSFAVTSAAGPFAIPDAPPEESPEPVFVDLPLSFPEPVQIANVQCELNLTHTYLGDLTIELHTSEGESVLLTEFVSFNDSENLRDTRFDDDAGDSIHEGVEPYTGSWQPDTMLSNFDMQLTDTTWSLYVIDSVSADNGTVDHVELVLTYQSVGSVTGTVNSNEAGNPPIVGAILSVEGLPNVTACSDQSGNYTLAPIPEGPNTINVSHSLYWNSSQEVTVTIGDPAGGYFSLAPSYGTPLVATTGSDSIQIIDETEVVDTIVVAQDRLIADVQVILNIEHSFLGDLDIRLVGPDSSEIYLTQFDVTLGFDNFVDTRFSDDACKQWFIQPDTNAGFTGTWLPDESLSEFDGISAAGNWVIGVFDTQLEDAGWLHDWTLVFRFLDDSLLTVEDEAIPADFEFYGNYPNPFNPATTFEFAVNRSTEAKLVLYNLLGQQVATLLEGRVTAGRHAVYFDGSRLASGVYLAHFSTPESASTRKIILLK